MMDFFYEDDHRPTSPIHPIEAGKETSSQDRRPRRKGLEIGILEPLLVLSDNGANTVCGRHIFTQMLSNQYPLPWG